MSLNDLYSPEAEAALLGQIIICEDFEILNYIASRLPYTAFYDPANEAIYKAVLVFVQKNILPDVINLPELLRSQDMLEKVGGLEYILNLAQGVGAVSNYPYYVNRIMDFFIKREYQSYAEDLRMLANPRIEIDELYNQSMEGMKRLYNLGIEDKLIPASKSLQKVLETKTVKLFNTGLSFIDSRHTIEAGRFILLAGKEKIGKTTLALNMIKDVLMQGKKVLFYSLEMPQSAIYDRLACIIANCDKGRPDPYVTIYDVERNRPRYYKLLEAFDNLWVRDVRGGVDIEKIEREARQIRPELIVIDNSKLIHTGFKKQGLEQHFNYIATSLFTLAGDCNSCVLLVAHLNRTKLAKEDSKNDALYGGGSLQQACDLALFIERPENETEDGSPFQKVTLEITANRYGAMGGQTLFIRRASALVTDFI